MLVAIHQPNFFPWLGYFGKIAMADRFVLLDTVAPWRGGSHYHNRVQILVSGRPHWMTMPLRRGAENRAKIISAKIAEDGRWRRSALRTIAQSYGKAPFFADIMKRVEIWFGQETDHMCRFNITVITEIAGLLGLESEKLVRASELNVSGESTMLLANLVRAVDGNAYLVGGGADGYQDDDAFSQCGIAVVAQNFVHPRYPQLKTEGFVPGLSILDCLMNCGPSGTASLLEL